MGRPSLTRSINYSHARKDPVLNLIPAQIAEICYETHRALKHVTHPAIAVEPWDDQSGAEQQSWAVVVEWVIAGEAYDDRSAWDRHGPAISSSNRVLPEGT
jgi:hypothetical protein